MLVYSPSEVKTTHPPPRRRDLGGDCLNFFTKLNCSGIAWLQTTPAVQCLSQEVFLSLHEDPVFKRSNPPSYLRQRTWRGTEDFVEGHRDLTGRRGRARRSLSRAPFWRLRTTQTSSRPRPLYLKAIMQVNFREPTTVSTTLE